MRGVLCFMFIFFKFVCSFVCLINVCVLLGDQERAGNNLKES